MSKRLIRHVTRLRPLIIVLGCLGAVCLHCSKKASPTQPVILTDYPANPDGMLLPGDATDNAFSAQPDLPPSPASETDIQADGLMVTRLEAVFADTATVGQVNAFLQAHGLAIISMLRTAPLVTLKSPRLAGKSSVDSLTAVLEGSGLFSFVFPSYAIEPEPTDSTVSTLLAKVVPGGSADDEITHLTELKMPAAWNVRDMIPSGSVTKVMVPDDYLQLTPHPEIPAQSFVVGGSASSIQRHGAFEGNHGFHVCGIIGASFDSTLATGVHPSAATNLTILSLPMGGFTWNDVGNDIATEISNHLPTGKFVLNTSLGYNDTGFVHFTKLHRAFLMINWRARVARIQDRFFHATAAGNDGLGSGDSKLASFNSPFCSAARFGHPHDMLTGAGLSAAQIATVDDHFARVIGIVPQATNPLHNVIIVGNNDASGAEVPGSNKQPDVHCVGELVYSTCVQADPGFPSALALGCKGSDGWYSGTSMAAPQVAGLAAYLWGIKPSLAVTDLVDIILRSDLSGQVDAYAAVQSLDLSPASPTIRMHLLDVANSADQEAPDGQFTEHDLAMFLNKFQFSDQQRGGALFTRDYSRFDLDGNGFTGDSVSKDGIFDLDVNNPQGFGTVSETVCGGNESFDEMHQTDYSILKYYAYSSLYTGDTTERDGLLGCGGGRIDFLDRSLSYHYYHSIGENNSTSPGGPIIICDPLDSFDVELYPITGTDGKRFVSQAGPCMTDDGASCTAVIDAQHQSTLSRAADGSTASIGFTSQIDESTIRTAVRDDQDGSAGSDEYLRIGFEVVDDDMAISLSAIVNFQTVTPWPAVLGVNGSASVDVTVRSQDEGNPYEFNQLVRIDLPGNTVQFTDRLKPGKYWLEITISGWTWVRNSKNPAFGYPLRSDCQFTTQATVAFTRVAPIPL